MAKKSDIILWIIGIIILLVVLNYFGIIDLSQIFSAAESVSIVPAGGSGGPGSAGIRP